MPRDALGNVIPGSYNPAQQVGRMAAQATRLPTPAVTGIMKTPNAAAVARTPVSPQMAQQRAQIIAAQEARNPLRAVAQQSADQLAAQQRPIAAQRPLPGPKSTVQTPEDAERFRQQDAISRAAGLRGFRAPLAR